MAAPAVSLMSMSQPEVVALMGTTVFVRSSGLEVFVAFGCKGAMRRWWSASSNVEFATSSRTKPMVAKAALL